MKKNEGTSKLQVLTAFLVMAVVAFGCTYAIRYVVGQYGSDSNATQSKASAESKADDIAQKVQALAQNADVDFTFDFASGSCIAVSQRGYSVLTIANKKISIYEQPFENTSISDNEKIAIAEAKKGTTEGSLFCEDVSFLGIDLADKAEGKATVNIRVLVNEKECTVTREITLNENTVKRANGQEVERIETEDTIEEINEQIEEIVEEVNEESKDEQNETVDGVDIVNENEEQIDNAVEVIEEVKQEEVNPEPKEELIQKEDVDQTGLINATGTLNLAVLKKSTADAEIVVTLLCEEQKAKAGWCVGGIGIGGTEVSDNEALQYKINGAPTVGKVYTARFAVCDILAQVRAEGTDTANVIFYNGFTVQNVELAN